MLTVKQKKLLEYINSFQKKNGVTPTDEENKTALDIKSK